MAKEEGQVWAASERAAEPKQTNLFRLRANVRQRLGVFRSHLCIAIRPCWTALLSSAGRPADLLPARPAG